MATNNFLSIPELVLKSDLLSTDSTFKLQNINWYTGSDGVVVSLTAGDFGSSNVGYGCFDERTGSQEFFTWDTSTIANATTTGITILSRGLPWGSDYTTSATARKFFHASGSKVLLYTNSPAFYNTFPNKANDETITGKFTFPSSEGSRPRGSSDTDTAVNEAYITYGQLARTSYSGTVNASTTVKGIIELATGAELAAGTSTGGTGAALVAAGSSFKNTSAGAGDANKVPVLNASGQLDSTFIGDISKTAAQIQVTTDASSANDAVRFSKTQSMVSQSEGSGTSGEAISVGHALYFKAADSKLYKTITSADESTFKFVGFALDSAVGSGTTIRFSKPGGVATGLSGLTADSYYYLTSVAGALSPSPGTVRSARVGLALSATTLLVLTPKYRKILSQTLNYGIGAANVTGLAVGFPPVHMSFYSLTAGTSTCECFSADWEVDGSGRCMWSDNGTLTHTPSIVSKRYISAGVYTYYAVANVTDTTFDLNYTTVGSPGAGASPTINIIVESD